MVNPWRGLGILITGLRVFVSTYESAIDAKGRVSIPAPFRAALGGGTRIFLWPSLDGAPCLEGGGEELIAMYQQTLLRLPPKSPARLALAESIFGGSADLKMEETGRIRLPDFLKEAAGLEKAVVFSGQMDSFQIWNPEALKLHRTKMLAEAQKPETRSAFDEAYDQMRREQLGGFAPRVVTGGEGS